MSDGATTKRARGRGRKFKRSISPRRGGAAQFYFVHSLATRTIVLARTGFGPEKLGRSLWVPAVPSRLQSKLRLYRDRGSLVSGRAVIVRQVSCATTAE